MPSRSILRPSVSTASAMTWPSSIVSSEWPLPSSEQMARSVGPGWRKICSREDRKSTRRSGDWRSARRPRARCSRRRRPSGRPGRSRWAPSRRRGSRESGRSARPGTCSAAQAMKSIRTSGLPESVSASDSTRSPGHRADVNPARTEVAGVVELRQHIEPGRSSRRAASPRGRCRRRPTDCCRRRCRP